MRVLDTDCLVLGAGLAGAAYAYHMGKQGYGVTLLSADTPKNSANSNWAQGGVIYHDKDDLDRLRQDINDASSGTSNPQAVEGLVQHGAPALKSLLLDELKVEFDREESTGDLKYTREGGHSEARIIFSKDTTGKCILDGVHKAIDWLDSVTRIENSVAIDLLTLSHSSTSYHDRYSPPTVFGAYVLDTETREVYAVRAKKTILATGGLGQLYNHTTNQRGIYGHGAAMAYRVGARMMDMEYIQFHPTAFCKKGAPTFLLTEALRGEGA
ncbi:MAG: FAD-dependent oxidoreductase, partial [Verrucomicrobiota bacterium]